MSQGIYFSCSHRPSESHLALNGRNIPLVNNPKYLGVNFDRRVTWRLHTEMIEAESFITFIGVYSLSRYERLSTNIKSTLQKALIRSLMTYARPAWEFAADTHVMKLQCLQNKVIHTFGNYPRDTPVRNLHMAFKISFVLITKHSTQATSRSHTKSC
jgi:hypothetical protein